ncbi:MAG TPA: hypothetical protein VEU33_25095 [Archangium sp.]|nr:hypothetical protein [Archangium sp.]
MPGARQHNLSPLFSTDALANTKTENTPEAQALRVKLRLAK